MVRGNITLFTCSNYLNCGMFIMSEIIYKQESYDICGAVFEVYNEMGCGYLEAVYGECLAREFAARGIEYVCQPELVVEYKGHLLEQRYKPDFICFGKIVVEIKSAKQLAPEHAAQTMNYLKMGKMKLGLLVNFGHCPGVEIKRIVL